MPIMKLNLPKSFVRWSFFRYEVDKLHYENLLVLLIKKIYLKNIKIESRFMLTLPAGFEPAAHCLEGSCSIQLS